MITTPAQILDAIYTDFAEWAKPKRGHVFVARDLNHALILLADTPAGWTGILHWEGDEPAGPDVRLGSVAKNNIRLFVRGSLGLTASPDTALMRANAVRDPLLGTLDDIRMRMISYTIGGVSSPNNRLQYGGTTNSTVSPEGSIVAVYSMLFTVYSVYARPTETVALLNT